jgi:hypothetical protein
MDGYFFGGGSLVIPRQYESSNRSTVAHPHFVDFDVVG